MFGIAAGIALKLMETGRVGPRVASLIGHAIVAAILAGALYLAYCWSWDRGRDHERAKWEAAAELLEDADAAADAEAQDVAHDTKESIDAGNERARAAAGASDDPLRAGLDSLRAEGARKGDQTTR